MDQQQSAERLVDQGKLLLDKGERDQAERLFRQAAQTYPLPQALNNWALCRYLADEYSPALTILSPLLAGPDPAPYSRALASLCYSALGRRQEAEQALQAAVRDLDQGLLTPALRFQREWAEYTTLIKQAAGLLGEHRLVLDLHGRWPGRELPLGAYAAGVAAFNLQRYEQAARHWRRVADREWVRLLQAFASVAEAMAGELIPPFSLEYFPDLGGKLPAKPDEADIRRIATLGTVRMRFLAVLFDKAADKPENLVGSLIKYGGDWGIELGKRFLQSNRLPMPPKVEAARALIARGVYAADEPIPVLHEGRQTSVVVKQMEVKTADPELDRRLQEAIALRDRGNKEAAYKLLSDMQAEGLAYPPAMVTLANLMRDRGELDGAQSLLELVDKLAPDEPGVLFNLAGLWLQRGNLKRAREFAERVDPRDMEPAFARALAGLKGAVQEAELLTELPDAAEIADQYRSDEEERPISAQQALLTALRKAPVQWLNAAAAAHGVAPARRREERAKALAAVLLDPAHLRQMISRLQPRSREALRYLLAEGGAVKLQALTRRFGTLDGDGFFWDEVPPASAIGQLRLLGLVYVGRALVDGKRHKLAVVPVELRDPLLRCL